MAARPAGAPRAPLAAPGVRVRCLILGIGNVLMGDEGVGVHVVRRLQESPLPAGVECLDGGTGGFHLLEPLQRTPRLVLVDATLDDRPAGTVRLLRPRFARDYPPTLTAHDIGLKDLLDALDLLGNKPEVVLFAVSIAPPRLGTALSTAIAALVPALVEAVLQAASAP